MKILWLTPYTPWPPTSGGKIRVYNLVRLMLEAGHQIELWCVDDRPAAWPDCPPNLTLRSFPRKRRLSLAAKLGALVSSLPDAAWCMRTRELLAATEGLRHGQFDVAVLEQARCGAVLVELGSAKVPFVFDAHDVESWLHLQLSKRAERLRTRWHFVIDGVKFRRLEMRLMRHANAVVAVSEPDRRRLQMMGSTRPFVVHPNGVDTEYFSWVDKTHPTSARLVMTGALGYRPNLDACLWLRHEIFPRIRALLPRATVTVVGGELPPDVERLHDPAQGFWVVGPVTDVRPYLRQADVFIAPLRMGSGTRLKALEALSSGLPLVATPLAVEGLGLMENGLALIADTPIELASCVRRAISDIPLRRRLVYEGRRYVERSFDWRIIASALEQTVAMVALQEGRTAWERAALGSKL